MKPKKTTIEGELEEKRKAMCDVIITRAATMMLEKAGASMPMALDRIVTYAAAQACATSGKQEAANGFRAMADRIEAGIFDEMCANVSARRRRNMQ